MSDFEINFLDHVAITVNDINASISWYKKVLGLKKVQLPKWGSAPIFMMAGKSGIALFPKKGKNNFSYNDTSIRIDHFAFNVSNENFEKAKAHFINLDLEFELKDHHYFHSLYINDLDGHTVELTTIKVDETAFYNGEYNVND